MYKYYQVFVMLHVLVSAYVGVKFSIERFIKQS